MPPPWLLLGYGYTATHLARRLLQSGSPVTATRRQGSEPCTPTTDRALVQGSDPWAPGSEPCLAARAPGSEPCTPTTDRALGQGSDPWAPGSEPCLEMRVADTGVAGSVGAACRRGAVVVHLAPPGEGDVGGEARGVVREVASAGARRLVYVSSTGVYAAAAGAWVDEAFAVAPRGGGLGVARLEAETALLAEARAVGLPAVALRVAGIYGPGRGVVARMRAGTYRIVGDGRAFVSRIHVEDLVSAIVAAGTVEPLPHEIYNVADDEPTTALAYAEAIAAALGLPMPPMVPIEAVDPAVAAMFGGDRRIANARLKRELGVVLRYPSFRESLAEEVGS